ncbi:hypothetical protein PG990_014349 [Apiospora arundinis]
MASRPTSGKMPEEEKTTKATITACALCRKCKLRCDGVRPTCETCRRLSHHCTYDTRKRRGPKKGYIQSLESRLRKPSLNYLDCPVNQVGKGDLTYFEHGLEQLETLLKAQEPSNQNHETGHHAPLPLQELPLHACLDCDATEVDDADQETNFFPESVTVEEEPHYLPDVGVGSDQPLPSRDDVDELYDVFFTSVHPAFPMIQRSHFLSNKDLVPKCLRYILWTLAASVTDKHEAQQDGFYQSARRHAQLDEMKESLGESSSTLAHCQTWILIATYEVKQMYFPKAWLSAGRAIRLAQMMQLHKLDRVHERDPITSHPKNWIELEERRRTFWMAFCLDRYTSILAGWPMTIDEHDVSTNLPSSQEAFEESKPMHTGSLHQAMEPGQSETLQPFGGVILTAALFGRIFHHLHRQNPDDDEDDGSGLNGGFWVRHRAIEAILLNTALCLPDHLRLPTGLREPNVVFLNLSLHTLAICLHQTAIFKANKQQLPVHISSESKVRCVTAAVEIAALMRMVSHMNLATTSPFLSFCVYVAARVFVQYRKTRLKDQQMESSLQFLLQIIKALGRKSPLTKSLLVQLDLDEKSSGGVV